MANFVNNVSRSIGAHLTTTDNTTVYSADVGYPQVIRIHCANLTASPVTATVSYFSAADNDQYRLLFQHEVPENGAIWLPLEAFALSPADEIRVQAGTAAALDVVLTISETPGRSG